MWGLGYSLVVESLPSIYEILGLIPAINKQDQLYKILKNACITNLFQKNFNFRLGSPLIGIVKCTFQGLGCCSIPECLLACDRPCISSSALSQGKACTQKIISFLDNVVCLPLGNLCSVAERGIRHISLSP